MEKGSQRVSIQGRAGGMQGHCRKAWAGGGFSWDGLGWLGWNGIETASAFCQADRHVGLLFYHANIFHIGSLLGRLVIQWSLFPSSPRTLFCPKVLFSHDSLKAQLLRAQVQLNCFWSLKTYIPRLSGHKALQYWAKWNTGIFNDPYLNVLPKFTLRKSSSGTRGWSRIC